MRCFHHEDHEAVGTCKSCGKGVCRECAVDLGKGLACPGRCEEDVAGLIALTDQNVRSAATQRGALGIVRRKTFAESALALAAGALFLPLGLSLGGDGGSSTFIVALGGVLILYAVYVGWRAWRMPKSSDTPDRGR